jgi:SNF2 family DNA or RNA helicase
MIEINWARLRGTPSDDQREGIRELVHDTNPTRGRVIPGVLALFDEPGVGKSFQKIAANDFLFEAGRLDAGIVIAPASVRIQWRSPDFGEIRKWDWTEPAVHEYHAGADRIKWQDGKLNWVVTNYEFIREPERLGSLLNQIGRRRVDITLDESSKIKSWKADQTKACRKLRKLCQRATVLNGTPVANSPLDLYSQMDFLSPDIIGAPNWWSFRARYAVMGGFKAKAVVGFRNLDELNRLVRPYILRREKRLAVAKRFHVREVALDKSSWKHYREMRDGLVTWLDGQPSMAPQAIVKVLRLAQITSGYLGGLTATDAENFDPALAAKIPPREIGREKLKALEAWLAEVVERDPNARVIVWGRFSLELERAQRALESQGIKCVQVRGGQGKVEREEAIKTFTLDRSPGPMVLFGSPHAGGLGLTLIEAHDVFYMSNDFSLLAREQSEDRAHRKGQQFDVDYTDLLATGPEGQKTIDHTVVARLRSKHDLAAMTTAEWRSALTEE